MLCTKGAHSSVLCSCGASNSKTNRESLNSPPSPAALLNFLNFSFRVLCRHNRSNRQHPICSRMVVGHIQRLQRRKIKLWRSRFWHFQTLSLIFSFVSLWRNKCPLQAAFIWTTLASKSQKCIFYSFVSFGNF